MENNAAKEQPAMLRGETEAPPSCAYTASWLSASAMADLLLNGAYKCLNDKYFTMVQASGGFTALLGYTAGELRENFGGRYSELIFPADRERIREEVRRGFEKGRTLELEYRAMAKDGRVVWVLDRCAISEEEGREYLYCVLIDISRSRAAQEELRRAFERQQIIMDQAGDVIFEWDLQKDELEFSANWFKKFGYPPITQRVSAEVPGASHINPDDIRNFTRLVQAVSAGEPYVETEMRMAGADGRYRWYKMRVTSQFDDNRKPYKAVGVIIDIDSQKKAEKELEARASRDTLTKLFNKAEGRCRIEEYLQKRRPDEICALMVIDVDDFKQVNDRYGHMFGDAVLSELALQISGLFRANDIICRVGGDEFVVLMPDIKNKKSAKTRAAGLTEAINSMLCENLQGTMLSCSIGLAYAENKSSFRSLFEQADKALYRAKSAGKNRCAVYDEKTAFGPCVSCGLKADTESGTDYSSAIGSLFNGLYESADPACAVHSALGALGRLFHAQRAYIFETLPSGDDARVAFEWCAEGVKPQKEVSFSYAQGGRDYRECFNDHGIFYCRDLNKLGETPRDFLKDSGAKALLQCAMTDHGRFAGFLGVDDCERPRLWTKEQIDALIFTQRVLCMFLTKERAYREAAAHPGQN